MYSIDYMYEVQKLFDARLGIGFSQDWIIQCRVWHRFLTPCLASRSSQTWYVQSLAQLQQLSLQMQIQKLQIFLFTVSKQINNINRRLKRQSWASDGEYKDSQLFYARRGVKKQCQTWLHRINQCYDSPMPYLASFFDAMSGVKKLTNTIPGINRPHSAFEPSFVPARNCQTSNFGLQFPWASSSISVIMCWFLAFT